MNIVESTEAYEEWLRECLRGEVVEKDLCAKHEKMSDGPFPFLRATYWRWAETILAICPKLATAPPVLAVGDIHLENYGTWHDADGRLIWGVNDFDEAAEMPYALDLVRLGTSAALGCPNIKSIGVICTNLLRGYRDGLDDPKPIVLDHDQAWLRKLLTLRNGERKDFWKDIEKLKPPKKPLKPRYLRALRRAMPEQGLEIDYRRRKAGAGSLGRPRFVGIAEWRGGTVVREVKAALPSAWTRPKGHGAPRVRCDEAATARYRSPDPWYALIDDVVVRRLSPNNRKLEAETDAIKLVDKRMLRLMAHDLAAVHLGRRDIRAAIQHDLEKRGGGWLAEAVERAAAFVRDEQGEWKKKSKK